MAYKTTFINKWSGEVWEYVSDEKDIRIACGKARQELFRLHGSGFLQDFEYQNVEAI